MLITIHTLELLNLVAGSIWLILIYYRGQFWRADYYIESVANPIQKSPEIAVIIPARNEEHLISQSVSSLLQQDYRGTISLIIVNDNSDDDTFNIIETISEHNNNVYVIDGKATPSDWTGKTWAMKQGVELAKKLFPHAEYYLFTDSDIYHHQTNVTELVAKAMNKNLALVSLMVKLRCTSNWERLLIPAFVFFFQKLYPFSWVNNPKKASAAAAGGCMLIKCNILEKTGGIEIIKGEIIDDCALAKCIKQSDRIWIGLTKSTKSLRKYNSLFDISLMVCRTAFIQLNYSFLYLIFTLVGMLVIYIVPLISIFIGILIAESLLTALGIMSLVAMSFSYAPTLKLYNRPVWEASFLPIAAFLYSVMTTFSAWQYLYGHPPTWRGRSITKIREWNEIDK